MLATPSTDTPSLPPGSIAASVKALSGGSQPPAAFRDAACATIRLSRPRGRAECDALALLFESNISDDRRTLILDLLATAGTPEAQITMRRMLSMGVARRNSRTFAAFVQRLGFMERPDGATLRFLISIYAQSQHETSEVRAACAYALGAGIGRAHVWGLSEPAISASEVLRRDLLQARTPAEKCALVTALGNAGLDSDVGVILRFVEDPDGRVRNAATLALRKMHTREARAALLLLLAGADHNVADSALSALFEQSLTRDEIVRLAELVVGGRTAITLDGRILRLLVTQKLGWSGNDDVVEDAVHLLLSRIEAHALRGSGERQQASWQEQSPPNNNNNNQRAEEVSGSRMIPTPRTPLPYSAGYRMVSGEERIPDTLDDAKLAALQPRPLEPSAPPPRRAVPPGAGTVAYGSVVEAIQHRPSGDASADAPAEVRYRSAFVAASPIVPLAVIR